MVKVKRGIPQWTFDAKRRSVIAYAFRSTKVFRSILSTLNQQAPAQVRTIALGSDRAAKIMAVRAAIARVAEIDPSWAEASVLARAVETNVPTMPLNDWELMQGARERALAIRDQLWSQRIEAYIYVGLEGGFHSISIEGEWHTFLRGWAYATDGKSGTFGSSPSISVPASLAKKVIEGRRELGLVIDEVAGTLDARSRQGAWGILSRDLVSRSMSFELALIAAFAPFYNAELYTD
jgi:non-canonical (house-cleaning) NTP pyrophosphatase